MAEIRVDVSISGGLHWLGDAQRYGFGDSSIDPSPVVHHCRHVTYEFDLEVTN